MTQSDYQFQPDTSPEGSLKKDKRVLTLANEYIRRTKHLPRIDTGKLKAVGIREAQDIGNVYEQAEHKPHGPLTSRHYHAFLKEIEAQFRFLQDKGFRFIPVNNGTQPYMTALDIFADVHSKKLHFATTEKISGQREAATD